MRIKFLCVLSGLLAGMLLLSLVPAEGAPMSSVQSLAGNSQSDFFQDHQGLANGWLIDETRTPFGDKFYRIFSEHWIKPASQEDYSIIIMEQPIPTSGLSSRIFVRIGDLFDSKTVCAYVLSPRTGDIKEQVRVCISGIHRYLERQESLQEQLEKLMQLQMLQQERNNNEE